MKRLVSACLAVLLLSASSMALADAKASEKTFCAVSDFFSTNKPLNTTRTTITYSLTLVGGTLATLVNIEAQRATLEKGLKASSISLRALSWAGPLKAFGRAAIPLMDNTAKVIKAARLNSKTARLYKKVYTPLSYAWMAVNGGMYAVQLAGVGVCGQARIMGVKVTKSGSVNAANKFASLARRYGGSIRKAVSNLNGAKRVIMGHGGTFRSIKRALRPIKRPLKKLQKGLKATNKAMKPVFVAARKLVKEMKKRRCITYGVKVKVKVKKKFWKTKVKTKKVKFCFRIAKVAGKIQKLAKAAQKPVNDVIKKTIKPLMKKIKKGLKKGLKLGKLKRYQKKLGQLGNKLGRLKKQLGGFKRKFTADKSALTRIRNRLR